METEFTNPFKEKKIETQFTHVMNQYNGWQETKTLPHYFDKVLYLGVSKSEGDIFACYKDGIIGIYKGVKGSEFD